MEEKLQFHDISYEVIETTKEGGHAFEIVRDLDFSKYSALVIIGGDGTVQEAINGMLVRSDGLKLPVGIVPNGYSNDMARSLSISSLEQAIDTICRKESVAMDSVKVLIDCESD